MTAKKPDIPRELIKLQKEINVKEALRIDSMGCMFEQEKKKRARGCETKASGQTEVSSRPPYWDGEE